VAGIVAGLGLTVALFVAGEAFANSPFEGPAKMGAVFSAVAALLAIVAGRMLKLRSR
jgi:NhaA family Na+:H+ antiporter